MTQGEPGVEVLGRGSSVAGLENVALHSDSQSLTQGGVAEGRPLLKGAAGRLRLALGFALSSAVKVHAAFCAVELLDREVDDVAAGRALGATSGHGSSWFSCPEGPKVKVGAHTSRVNRAVSRAVKLPADPLDQPWPSGETRSDHTICRSG